jgi:uncharacterized cupin superfamily protein
MPAPRITRIDSTEGLTPTLDRPRPDRLEEGDPQRWTWLMHEAGPMSAGVWACEVGRWRIAFPAHKQEYFFVLEGQVRLHGADGSVVDVHPGQGAVIPPGFEGAFEVVRPVRKHFVLVDLPSVP